MPIKPYSISISPITVSQPIMELRENSVLTDTNAAVLQPNNARYFAENHPKLPETTSFVSQHFKEFWPLHVIGGIVVAAWLISKYKKKIRRFLLESLKNYLLRFKEKVF
jgi:hypothetical protein